MIPNSNGGPHGHLNAVAAAVPKGHMLAAFSWRRSAVGTVQVSYRPWSLAPCCTPELHKPDTSKIVVNPALQAERREITLQNVASAAVLQRGPLNQRPSVLREPSQNM